MPKYVVRAKVEIFYEYTVEANSVGEARDLVGEDYEDLEPDSIYESDWHITDAILRRQYESSEDWLHHIKV